MSTKCYICHSISKQTNIDDSHEVICPLCGNYKIDGSATVSINSRVNEQERYILSGVIRNRTENKQTSNISTDDFIKFIESAVLPKNPFEIIDNMLLFIHKQFDLAYEYIDLNPETHYTLFYCKNPAEFNFFLRKAVDLNYLEFKGVIHLVRLSLKGWEKINDILSQIRKSNKSFVAMSFANELDDAWHGGFRPALEKSGFNPLRIDLVQHNEKICDKILLEIKQSGLLVADFSGNRAGVYFEAGFALGLGIPVIWTCRNDYIDSLHFDTRQYNHIVWDTVENLKEYLYNRIMATII